jgi:hypothetical protein
VVPTEARSACGDSLLVKFVGIFSLKKNRKIRLIAMAVGRPAPAHGPAASTIT